MNQESLLQSTSKTSPTFIKLSINLSIFNYHLFLVEIYGQIFSQKVMEAPIISVPILDGDAIKHHKTLLSQICFNTCNAYAFSNYTIQFTLLFGCIQFF